MNIWSHLLGALATICLGGYLGYWTWVDDPMFELRRFSRFTLFHDAPASVTWHDKAMFGVFFLGSFVCFICSSVFHTSLCHRGQEVYFHLIEVLRCSDVFSCSADGQTHEQSRLPRYTRAGHLEFFPDFLLWFLLPGAVRIYIYGSHDGIRLWCVGLGIQVIC